MVAWRGWFDAGFDPETQPSANRSHRIAGRRSEPRRALAARSAARRRGGHATLPRAQPPRFPLRAPARGGRRDTARGLHCHHPHRRRRHRRRSCSRPSRTPEDHRPRWRRRVRRRRPRRQHPPRAGGRRRPRGRRAGSSRVAAASAPKLGVPRTHRPWAVPPAMAAAAGVAASPRRCHEAGAAPRGRRVGYGHLGDRGTAEPGRRACGLESKRHDFLPVPWGVAPFSVGRVCWPVRPASDPAGVRLRDERWGDDVLATTQTRSILHDKLKHHFQDRLSAELSLGVVKIRCSV